MFRYPDTGVRPFVWAHRGARASAPENTLAAFRLAAQQGADGVEFDVHVSRDGVLAVLHDAWVSPVVRLEGGVPTGSGANGSAAPADAAYVADLDWADLRTLVRGYDADGRA